MKEWEMKKSRYSEAEIFRMLKQDEGGMPVAEICRRNKISAEQRFQSPTVNRGQKVPPGE